LPLQDLEDYVPFKQRRRSKKNATLHENNDAAVDAVTHVEVEVMMEVFTLPHQFLVDSPGFQGIQGMNKE
jgi:hypothetical protein